MYHCLGHACIHHSSGRRSHLKTLHLANVPFQAEIGLQRTDFLGILRPMRLWRIDVQAISPNCKSRTAEQSATSHPSFISCSQLLEPTPHELLRTLSCCNGSKSAPAFHRETEHEVIPAQASLAKLSLFMNRGEFFELKEC